MNREKIKETWKKVRKRERREAGKNPKAGRKEE